MGTGSTPQPEEKKEELSIPEIHARYKGKWVAIVVTKRDDNLQPTHGTIAAEDLDRYRLRGHVAKYADICIFYEGVSGAPRRW
jgi:hypothetical protein